MNSPEENRRRIAQGADGPEFNGRGAHGDDRWSRMLTDYRDMKFAAEVGGVNIRPDNAELNKHKRLPHRRNF